MKTVKSILLLSLNTLVITFIARNLVYLQHQNNVHFDADEVANVNTI